MRRRLRTTGASSRLHRHHRGLKTRGQDISGSPPSGGLDTARPAASPPGLAEGPPDRGLSARGAARLHKLTYGALLVVAVALLGAGPSPLVLPPAPRGVRFDHAAHQERNIPACLGCHPRAASSRRAREMLRPEMRSCAGCHEVPDPAPPTPPAGQHCGQCHLALGVMPPGPLAAPPASVSFNHALHHERGAGCTACHRGFDAGRVPLPRMRDCNRCHDGVTAGSRCHLCHRANESDRLDTDLPGGRLIPTGQTGDDDHRRNWISRHGGPALAGQERCESCHAQRHCLECHAGSLKPQSIHGGNWATLHPAAARSRSQECTACHRTRSFCLSCHSRLGLSPDSPWTRDNLRVHPRDWADSTTPRHPGTARRNPNSCLACHEQSRCISCHGSSGAGFGGIPPHRHLSRKDLERRWRLNRRPCDACHAGQYPEGFP